MVLRGWAGSVQESTGVSWQRQSTLYAAAPPTLVAWSRPAPSGDAFSTRSEVFCRQLIDHSSSCYLIVPHAATCRRACATLRLDAFQQNQILCPAGKTMWSSSCTPDWEWEMEGPAVAPMQAKAKLKCQTVTAILLYNLGQRALQAGLTGPKEL